MSTEILWPAFVLASLWTITSAREPCAGSDFGCFDGYFCCDYGDGSCCAYGYFCAGSACISYGAVIGPVVAVIGGAIFLVIICMLQKKKRQGRVINPGAQRNTMVVQQTNQQIAMVQPPPYGANTGQNVTYRAGQNSAYPPPPAQYPAPGQPAPYAMPGQPAQYPPPPQDLAGGSTAYPPPPPGGSDPAYPPPPNAGPLPPKY